MRFKILLIVAAALFVALVPQAERPGLAQAMQREARKLDEFSELMYSDLIARLDNLAILLLAEPDARAFLIVYRTRRDLPGLSNRYALRMKTYLVNRGVSRERVITVDGGEASCLTQELWIVPPGTTPKPRSDAYSRVFVDTDAARLFDEFSFYSSQDENEAGGYSGIEDGAAKLDGFAEALRSQPRARAHIIAYGQYYIERGVIDDEEGRRGRAYIRPHLDPPNAAQKELKIIKNALVKIYRLPPSRITLVDGGYRKARKVELWIVPPGEAAPIATPNSFPGRKRRS